MNSLMPIVVCGALILALGCSDRATSNASMNRMDASLSQQQIEKILLVYVDKYKSGSEPNALAGRDAVATENTAVAIACAVWKQTYGEPDRGIGNEAYLVGDYWYVQGVIPKDTIGGTPIAVIARSNGAIVAISHSL